MAKGTTYFFRRSGFTLLEMSLVLVVLSLILTGGLTILNQTVRMQRSGDVQAKLDRIEKAITNYRRLHNKLPCPADGTIPLINPSGVFQADFGVEVDSSGGGSCTGATFTDGSNTVGGVVPVRTLGLADEDAFDPWGGRFMYIVDKRVTKTESSSTTFYSSCTSAITTCGPKDTTVGSIRVNDGSGTARTSSAILLIMSFGGNGHGAYQGSGAIKSWGSTNADEQKNCHCTSTGAAAAFDATFVMHPPKALESMKSGFDDIIRYYLRSSPAMLSASEAGN